MTKNAVWTSVLLAGLLVRVAFSHGADTQAPDPEEKYRKSIFERADKIVATLGIEDQAAAMRVRDTLAEQYFGLRKIHDARAREAKTAPKESNSEREKLAAETGSDLERLHSEFLRKLATELDPAQIEKVKDGMTYGVVPLTYGVYLKMYPTLKEEEKHQIMTWLVEAREQAMDQGTSEEKHAVFGKYKGRINNYLSKAGYDSKKGQEDLRKQSQQKESAK